MVHTNWFLLCNGVRKSKLMENWVAVCLDTNNVSVRLQLLEVATTTIVRYVVPHERYDFEMVWFFFFPQRNVSEM